MFPWLNDPKQHCTLSEWFLGVIAPYWMHVYLSVFSSFCCVGVVFKYEDLATGDRSIWRPRRVPVAAGKQK